MRLPLPPLPLSRVAGRRRFVAVADRDMERSDAERRRHLVRLRDRYVGGELTLAQYEAELERLLSDGPVVESPPLRLRPGRGGLGVALGTGAALLLATGLALARVLRRPAAPDRSQRGPTPALLVVDVLDVVDVVIARWPAAGVPDRRWRP